MVSKLIHWSQIESKKMKHMKNLALLILIVGFSYTHSYSQSVGIAEGEITPHASAALEIRSNTKGLLIPRMTRDNRTAIDNPAVGLLVYQIDGNKGFYYSDGNNWYLVEGTTGKVDNDPTNELQTVSLVGDTLFLSQGGYAILPETAPGSDEQTLSIIGDTLLISNGNYVILPKPADDMGSHSASQNIELNSYYISSDGDDEGISINTNGDVRFSHNITIANEAELNNLQVTGSVNLGTNAIQSAELDALSVTSSKIANNAISTSKIMDAQITAAKLHPMGASNDQFLRFNGTSWAPASISSGLNYMGTWDASSNDPPISNAGGSNGHYYIVSTAGSQNLGSGIISFDIGDWAIHNGTAFQKINNSNDVNSVFGRTGIITAQYGDYAWSQIDLSSSSLNGIADVNSATVTSGNILIANGSQWVSSTISGDATLSGAGNLQINDGAVSYSNLQDATGSDNTILKWNGSQWQEILISSIEGDGSTSNEIQSLNLSGNTLSISSGNSISLSSYLDNTDDQQLTLSGTSLSIEDGNAVDLSSLSGVDTDDQTLSLTGNTLSIEDGNSVSLSSFLDNTDDQQLTLTGTSLSIESGNAVDLSSIAGVDTDDQTLSLSNDTLYIEDGNSVPLKNYVNTDDQHLTLVGATHTLSIEDGNAISLAAYVNTDNQNLTLSGNLLSIDDGNSVSLIPYLDNTDNQNLLFNVANDSLQITSGNKVYLGSLKDNLGNHLLSENLVTNGYFLSLDGANEGIFVGENGWVSIGNQKPDYKFHITEDEKAYMRIDNSDPNADGVLQIAMTQTPNPNFSNDFIQFYSQGNTLKGSISGNLAGTGVSFNTTSDKRLKENLVNSKFGLSTIMNIEVYDYNFIGSTSKETGFIAQELQKEFPQAVTIGGDNPKKNPWTVDYSKLTPVLTKAVQELNIKVTGLEKKNNQLEQENTILKEELKNLRDIEQRISELEKLMKSN